MKKYHDLTLEPKEFVALYEKHGSVKAVARLLKDRMGWSSVHNSYTRAVEEGLMDPVRPGRKTDEHVAKVIKGRLKAKMNEEEIEPPVIEGNLRARYARPLKRKVRGVTRFIFTSAQNNTPLFEKFWTNLLVYRQHIGATLHVSRFAYIKRGLGASGDKARWMNREDYREAKDLWWDPRLDKHLNDDRCEIAPGLVFVGDSNILPTVGNPLSNKETFTGRASGIFPHVKFAMQSVATVNSEEATKFNYTTGAVTMRNYIARDAGLKAEFHHCYGALLVEVDEEGNWWVRQTNADSDGVFYEIDPNGDGALRVKDGLVTTGHRIEALNSGDNHAEDEDEGVFAATWGDGGIMDCLRPRYQFFNDLCSFNARSHHSVKDPHLQFLYHIRGTENVRANMDIVKQYLERTVRPWCENIVVGSNHHDHVGRWLKEQDGRRDPVNARFWSKLNDVAYEHMEKHRQEPNHLQEALRIVDSKMERRLKVKFLKPDGSFIICHDAGGGIECGLHGHLGPNGARGSARNISTMGRKANIGHSHSACIIDGVYQAGTSSKLRLDYNSGPSSWSQTHILTYPNGKRTLCTVWRGKWRA